MMHFVSLSNDALTVYGNRLRRVRDVDMKHDFAFVVCTLFSLLFFFLPNYFKALFLFFKNDYIFIT